MTEIDPAILPLETDIFLLEDRLGIQYVWDLKRQIKEWNVEAVGQLLETGVSIAVISRGDPRQAITEATGENVDVQIIDRFDYNKKRTQKEKTILSLVKNQSKQEVTETGVD